MRHRTKGDRAVESLSWHFTRTFPGLDETYIETRENFSHFSDLYDMTSPLPRVDHPCRHTRSNAHVMGSLPTLTVDSFGGTVTCVPPQFWRCPYVGDPGVPDVSSDYSKFLSNSAHYFQDQFRSNVSLANFLIELKDFKEIVGKLRQIGFASFRSFGRDLKRFVRSEMRERTHSGIGSQFLDWTFNWKPLVEDSKKLIDSYGIASRRLRFLMDKAHWVDHRRIRFEVAPYSKGFDDILLTQADNFSSAMIGLTYKIRLIPQWCQIEMNASAHIENKLNLATLNMWDACADQLGLNNSPKILWNATKLSWLVDFFIDSKDFFNAFEKQCATGHLGIDGGCASVKKKLMYSIEVEYSVDNFNTLKYQVGSYLIRWYQRDNLILREADLFSVNQSLTTDQQVILAALAESQFRLSGRLMTTWKRMFARNTRTFGRAPWKRISGQ